MKLITYLKSANRVTHNHLVLRTTFHNKQMMSSSGDLVLSFHLEQLTDTKYGNPCRTKIQPPPTQIEIFTPENSKLQNIHSSLRLRRAINGALQILIFLKQYDQGDVKFYVNFAAISNTNYLN